MENNIKNNIEIIENEDFEKPIIDLIEIINKNGKLEQFFKIMDILIDDNINDDYEINFDNVDLSDYWKEDLEKKEN
jgi:hypothetical protein